MQKTKRRDAENAARVKRTAVIQGVGENYVYKVIAGDRENEEVMSTFMELLEGENKLIDQVKKLVPVKSK